MAAASLPSHPVRFAKLPQRRASEIVLEPGAGERQALAAALGIPAIEALRFEATLRPEGSTDWRLDGQLTATVEQTCVVTLEPVRTVIAEAVGRRYMAEPPRVPEGGEVEMPEDDTVEPRPETVDLYDVAAEALALALPPYPRAPGAELGEAVYTEPGAEPLTDAEVKPFAGLKALRDKLGKDEN